MAPVIDELRGLGETIDGLREQLMIEPFALHREFFDARGPVAPSAVGEPQAGASSGSSGWRRKRARRVDALPHLARPPI